MDEKQFDPARINDESPAPGMAAVNTYNPEEGERAKVKGENESNESERAKGKGEKDTQGAQDSDVSQDPNRFNGPKDENVVAELNIRSDSPASRDHSKSVEEDVTPRNLEADSDGA